MIFRQQHAAALTGDTSTGVSAEVRGIERYFPIDLQGNQIRMQFVEYIPDSRNRALPSYVVKELPCYM
jgi:hypothetical protein